MQPKWLWPARECFLGSSKAPQTIRKLCIWLPQSFRKTVPSRRAKTKRKAVGHRVGSQCRLCFLQVSDTMAQSLLMNHKSVACGYPGAMTRSMCLAGAPGGKHIPESHSRPDQTMSRVQAACRVSSTGVRTWETTLYAAARTRDQPCRLRRAHVTSSLQKILLPAT